MSYPSQYTPSFSFTDYQASNPTAPLPGNSLDNELFVISQRVAQIITNLQGALRSDGALTNGSVGTDQLSTEVDIGITPAVQWATATQYLPRSYVFGPDGNLYKCNTSHISNVFATDLAASKWTIVVSWAATASLRTENVFRNPCFDVAQRASTSISSGTTAYGPDGWRLGATGAGLVWSLATPGASSGPEGRIFSLSLACASGLTGAVMDQRIEAVKAARLYGLAAKRVTASITFQNFSGVAIAPKLTVKHAGATNDFSSPVTDVSAVTLQSVANGAGPVTCAYTFTTVSGTNNGLQVSFDFGAGLNAASGAIFIDEVTLSVTPQFPLGVQTSPPFCVVRDIVTELAYCQRHLPCFGALTGAIGLGTATSTTAAGFFIPFHTQTWAAVTGLSVTTVGNLQITDMAGADVAALTGITFSNASEHGAFVTTTVASGLTSGATYQLRVKTALTGNLRFTGAEL